MKRHRPASYPLLFVVLEICYPILNNVNHFNMAFYLMHDAIPFFSKVWINISLNQQSKSTTSFSSPLKFSQSPNEAPR